MVAMDLFLQNQVAVVAGGANGIGRAIAEAFVAEGARAGVLDISPRCEQAAVELAAAGPPTAAVRCDITDLAAVERARDELAAALGPAHHVVVAAAIGSGKFGYPFLNLQPGDWRRVLEVNVEGAVNVTHAFAPGLVARRAGTMLYLSSVAGQFGSQTDPPYSASKAALINFAQCVAKDLAPHGVRANSICPGMVRTDLNRDVWAAWNRQQPEDARRSYEDWADEKVRAVVPLQRWQDPEDIAAMAVFLASPRAKNVTGQTVNVDGGFVMHW